MFIPETSQVVWLVPSRNEESTIGGVLSQIPREHTVFLADSSEDRTPQIGSEYGAKIVRTEALGKGLAVRETLKVIYGAAVDEGAIVVMLDADGTYDPQDHVKMMERLAEDVGMVVGNRFHKPEQGSMSTIHLIANKVLTWFANGRYGVQLRDALSGFKVFRLKAINPATLRSLGFDTEVDFIENILKQGLKVVDAPVSYRRRDGSKSKIRVRDGFKILFRILFA